MFFFNERNNKQKKQSETNKGLLSHNLPGGGNTTFGVITQLNQQGAYLSCHVSIEGSRVRWDGCILFYLNKNL